MATTTPTFKGPVRGREYGGKIARRVTWTFDSGQKRFQQVIDSMTNAEAACREFHEAVSA